MQNNILFMHRIVNNAVFRATILAAIRKVEPKLGKFQSGHLCLADILLALTFLSLSACVYGFTEANFNKESISSTKNLHLLYQ